VVNNHSALREISTYLHATTRLDDESIFLNERVKVAHAAMKASIWFHTSIVYGNVLEILGKAFPEQPIKIPILTIKIGLENVDQLKGIIEENLGACRRIVC
jgi:hypothetical protein